jgi:nicotinate-nucleotide pyrophosphorylase (carboxylating)
LADYSELVARALAEDIGSGDVTTLHTVPADLRAEGVFHAKQQLVLAGIEILRLIFPALQAYNRDGDTLEKGQAIAKAIGQARFLLTHERVALNFLQRLSGIATLTRAYVNAVAGTGTKILDTRKTTPGLRGLEKMATHAGGAVNHRMGLWDAILIKNNHIDLAGGVKPAVEKALLSGIPVECEVRTHDEIVDALSLGVVRLLLDNMTPAQAAEEIRFIKAESKGACSVEISGGVTLETVRAYAETGADFISVGALTHSATAVDINFRIAALHD